MEKEAYKLRFSSDLIPLKGLSRYQKRNEIKIFLDEKTSNRNLLLSAYNLALTAILSYSLALGICKGLESILK